MKPITTPERDVHQIKRILAFAAVILSLYLLDVFSFIFIPLVSSVFLLLLLTPLMRWLTKKNVHTFLSIGFLGLFVLGLSVLCVIAAKYAAGEIISAGKEVWPQIEFKLNQLIKDFGILVGSEETLTLKSVLGGQDVSTYVLQYFGSTFTIVRKTVTGFFIMVFFLFLLLAGSLNFEKIANITSFSGRQLSLRAFLTVERNIVTFLTVKTIISFLTGATTTLVCIWFDVDFPIFWGIITFLLNYVQMIGSIFMVILLSLFSMVQFDVMSTILLFSLSIAGVQILYGSIMEPIFMGKSFKINTITILVMLMFWGYLWGIAGLILSVPITAVVKVVFENFPGTARLARLMS
jgi:AI-2 transport protein TqsA